MKIKLKKHLPSAKSLQNSRELKGLKSFFHASCFWSHDQQSVARGVAAGFAGAVIPGFQIFYAAILVILLRGNLAIALLCTLITNPFTFIPISYFTYSVGSLIIGNDKTDFAVQHFRWDFSSFHAFGANVSAWILQFGKAFFIGLPFVSICSGLIGYFGTILIWKIYGSFFPKKKKSK